MQLAEYLQKTEAQLGTIEANLMRFHPQALQCCQEEMANILKELRRRKLAAEPLDERDRHELAKFRKSLVKLQARADQGANLCLGWRQLCLTAGYTSQGHPQFFTTESSASYEG